MKRSVVIGALTLALGTFAVSASALPDPHVHNPKLDHLAVRIQHFRYHAPHHDRIMVGRPIDVTNTDGVPHSLTADDASFDTGVFTSGTVTIHAPEEPGDYPFHCTIHPGMTGVLDVLPNP